jgi:phytoene synthase
MSAAPVPSSSLAPWTWDAGLLHGARLDLAAARRFCAALARSHYENFPVALALFRPEQRRALEAIYAFARLADDFADEPAFAGRRERLLLSWLDQLERCWIGDARHPVFVALGAAASELDLPIGPFRDLLSAFLQDCAVTRYATWADVLDYCRRSADPVGRLVLHVLGETRPECLERSDCICTALQLTNFWQDLSVDPPRDRIYVPLEDLDRFHVPVSALRESRIVRGLADLVRLEADRTEDLFRRGRPLASALAFPGSAYVALVWLGDTAVLRLVRDAGEDVVRRRPALDLRSLARFLAPRLRGRLGVHP